MIMSKKIEDILIEEGFTVEVDSGGEIEIRQTTPAGEDWGFYLDSYEDFVEYANNFDKEEEFRLLFNSNCEGLPDARTLLDDQDWKEEKLEKTARRIQNETVQN